MWEMVLIWFQLFLRLASMVQIHGLRKGPEMETTAECGAAVLSRAAREQRRKVALSGNKQSMPSAGFQSRAPNDSLRREMESSGEALQIGARFGRRANETRATERRPSPSTPSGRRPSSGKNPNSKTKKQLHVHPVVDLLVVLGLLPRRDARDVVAPVGVARRRVVVARPFRGLIDETHLFFILICQ